LCSDVSDSIGLGESELPAVFNAVAAMLWTRRFILKAANLAVLQGNFKSISIYFDIDIAS
jgi:hypothetical protein